MAKSKEPSLKLSVKDHLGLIDAIFRDEGFQARLKEDPVAALSEFAVKISKKDLKRLDDEAVTLPSKAELKELLDRRKADERSAAVPFDIIHILCRPDE
jgi:hypothetical protein